MVPHAYVKISKEQKSGGCIRQHNVDIHKLNPEVTKYRMRRAGHVARMEELRSALKISVGKPDGNSSFGRTRRSWKYKIGTDLLETKWEDVDWIHPAQDRDKWRALLNTVISLRMP
jgi:hypothetical protein